MGDLLVAKIEGIKNQINKDGTQRDEIISTLLGASSDIKFLIKILLILEHDVSKWVYNSDSEPSHSQFFIESLRAFPNSLLADFILQNSVVDVTLDGILEEIVLTGNIQIFLKLAKRTDFSQPKIHELFCSLLRLAGSNEILVKRDVQISTSGENNFLSIGNPLGTSKRKFIIFPDEKASPIRIRHIAIGLTTTIFLPESSHQNGNYIFVSGKFGQNHYITPQRIQLDENAVCCCVGISHSIICCSSSILVIGDNSKNQLGCGPQTIFVKNLKQLNLHDQIVETPNSIVDCQTSNNHTVIFTKCGFIVAGQNVGQMGKYASRAYGFKLIQPRSFTRLLAPDDAFSISQFTRIALSDDATAIYLGCRVKFFFEYREYKFSIDSDSGGRTISSLAICKPNGSSKTYLLIYSSTTEFFVWTKSSIQLVANPIWTISSIYPTINSVEAPDDDDNEEEMVVNPAGSSMQHTAGQFSCSNTGSFVFIHKWILHFGELSIDNGTLSCRIERVKDSPGYVDQAFMSPTGGNVACAVKRNRTPTKSSNELRNRTNYRMAMFYAAQRHRPSEENSNLVQFFVGADILCVDVFMLKIRFPSILSKVDASGQIHFTTHNLLIVTQMLEFIYSGTCEVFQTVDGCFSEHMARRIMSDYGICDLCENKMPLIDFPVNNDPADDLSSERICSVQSGVDISNPELFDSLENLLNRMTILANELEFPTFRTKCSDVLRVLYGSANCPKISADCFFIIPTIDFNAVFVNPDVILCCEDGSLHFMRSLLMDLPYFETFYRWNSETNVRSINVDSTVETVTVFLKFQISNTIDGLYSFEQIVKAFMFSDRYELIDFMKKVLELLECEVHMDYLPELCQLSNTFDNPQLDSILVEYIIEHLPLVIDNIFLLDLLPNRLLTLLNKTIAGNFHKCRTAHTVSQTRSELQYRFLRLANEYLATLDDMSPSEFLQFIKKRPRASHKKADGRRKSESVAEKVLHVDQNANTVKVEQTIPASPMEIGTSSLKGSEYVLINSHSPHNGHCYPMTLPRLANHTWVNSQCSPPTATTSLHDVMEKELRIQQEQKMEQKPKNRARTISAASLTKQTIHKQQQFAWAEQKVEQQSSSQFPPPESFDHIQEDERHLDAVLSSPKPCKPMHLTDIEERAIQQLEQYYLSLYEEGEVAISVRRLPRIDEHDLLKQKTPNWSKSYKQKLCPSKK